MVALNDDVCLSTHWYQVRRCDHGNKVKIHVSNLYPLPSSLIGSLAIECTVNDIRLVLLTCQKIIATYYSTTCPSVVYCFASSVYFFFCSIQHNSLFLVFFLFLWFLTIFSVSSRVLSLCFVTFFFLHSIISYLLFLLSCDHFILQCVFASFFCVLHHFPLPSLDFVSYFPPFLLVSFLPSCLNSCQTCYPNLYPSSLAFSLSAISTFTFNSERWSL